MMKRTCFALSFFFFSFSLSLSLISFLFLCTYKLKKKVPQDVDIALIIIQLIINLVPGGYVRAYMSGRDRPAKGPTKPSTILDLPVTDAYMLSELFPQACETPRSPRPCTAGHS